MRKYVILISSGLLCGLGYLIEDRGLAMHVTSGGEIVYPISSGSDDGFLLKTGLYLFAITFIYSVISIIRWNEEVTLLKVYAINSLVYFVFLFLVMLDSSIIGAAKLGDWLPLAANSVWVLSFGLYSVMSLNRGPQHGGASC